MAEVLKLKVEITDFVMGLPDVVKKTAAFG